MAARAVTSWLASDWSQLQGQAEILGAGVDDHSARVIDVAVGGSIKDPVPSTIIGILPVGGQPGIEIVKFESGHEIGD
jgi:hypothetical protein